MAARSAPNCMCHPFERYRGRQRARIVLRTLNIDGAIMFLTIAFILLVLWVLGAFVVPVGGGLIHILLVLAVIAVIWHLVSGRRVA